MMIPLAVQPEPLPISATATAVLIASLLIVVLWVAYLYR